MKISEITTLALRYDAPLCRYARFIVRHEHSAAQLVVEVFEDYYANIVPMEEGVARIWLKSRLYRKCQEWLKDNAIRHYMATHPMSAS